jgi:hypothetical protein
MIYYLQGSNSFCLYDASTQRRTWMGSHTVSEALSYLRTSSNTTFAENLYAACQQVQAWNSQEPPVVYTLADHPELFI